jgi:two-component system sensor histidine kinase PilS (NtrC family)
MDIHQLQPVIISAVMLLVVFIFIFLVRNIMSYQRKKSEQAQKDTSQVGFVVDTFHELVSKLREKERELEALRSLAEERASSVELYNEDIIQSVPSGVVSFDQDLKLTRINASALKILDMPAIKEAQLAGRDYAEVFKSPIREMIREQRIVERAEIAYTGSSGKRLWIGLTLSPLRDSSNSVIGRILIFTDLTELKAFQSQEELREKLSNLGEMSAGIAHELRNPLAVISGYTRILLKNVDASLKPAVESIGKEVGVMDRIITDFLSFARPAQPLPGRIDFSGLMENCFVMIREAFPKVVIRADISNLPDITADEVLMRQAISNILQNAAEAMPDGGEITVSYSCNFTDFTLSVADTGHGVPDNIRDRIYLPFYTTKERGTGLGLAIVHRIIDAHGGSIKVDSTSAGAVFSIIFPVSLVVSEDRKSEKQPE